VLPPPPRSSWAIIAWPGKREYPHDTNVNVELTQGGGWIRGWGGPCSRVAIRTHAHVIGRTAPVWSTRKPMLRRPIPAGEHERPRARVRSGDTSASKGVGLGARAVEHLLAVCVDATPVTGELSVSGAHPSRSSSSFFRRPRLEFVSR
jgi:hypothetical protein